MPTAPHASEVERQLDATREQLIGHIEQFKIDREKTQDLSQDLQKTWSISLSVANGSGLIAAGGALIKVEKLDLWLTILPAMWCFAVGLVIAGLLPLFQSKMYSSMSQSFGILHTLSKFSLNGSLPSNFEQGRAESKKHGSRVTLFNRLTQVCTYLSCILFSCGTLWPLTVLTFGIHL